jgi:Tfp pilus assembly protein PilN
MRTGPFAYVLVGGLGLLLLLIVAVTLTSKQISDREAEKQSLQQELDVATARASSLRAFADFRAVQESRTATVSSLAQSRFDWERVMHELSLILPDDIWLVNLTGTVSPEVQVEGDAGITSRASVPGPALQIEGCGPSQDSVAAFVAALEDIDGVTRVGVNSSERADAESGADTTAAPAAASTGAGAEDCRTSDQIVKFEIVVAFDAVPTPSTATAAPSVPAPVAPPGSEPELADARTQEQVANSSVKQQTAKAEQARHNLTPGG